VLNRSGRTSPTEGLIILDQKIRQELSLIEDFRRGKFGEFSVALLEIDVNIIAVSLV